MTQSSDPRGFTIIEVTTASVVFVVLFVALWELFERSGDALQYNLRAADLEGALRRVSERVAEELKDSGTSEDGVDHVASHPATVTTSAAALRFQRRIAFTGEASDWSTEIAYSLAASPGETAGNGKDDDGDGVVDEQRVVRSQDGVTVVIADGVTGLAFRRNAGEYRMDMDVAAARVLQYDEAPTARAATVTVALRNKP